ncbi:hypothetical protein GOODEAATRI_025295, partial [Goodea atripinnis]
SDVQGRAEAEQARGEGREPSKRSTAAAGGAVNRRGRGGGHHGRGRFNVRRDGPMKFEKDFDFESANAQFNKEEIEREFQSKLKLKDEKTEKALNGEEKADSGVETQKSEGNNEDESDPLGPHCYYDKSKSFFDNISCDDMRERRQTWAEERRMNAETFGIPLRQGRGRGGYRGRGGLGFRGGRGRSSSRGSFGPPQGSSFRGGYRGNQAGREFANLPYRAFTSPPAGQSEQSERYLQPGRLTSEHKHIAATMALSADPNYKNLEQWYRTNGNNLKMRAMFDSDPERFRKFRIQSTRTGELAVWDFWTHLANFSLCANVTVTFLLSFTDVLTILSGITSDNVALVVHSTTLKTDDGDILLDYSKNLINQDVMTMLLALVRNSLQLETRLIFPLDIALIRVFDADVCFS